MSDSGEKRALPWRSGFAWKGPLSPEAGLLRAGGRRVSIPADVDMTLLLIAMEVFGPQQTGGPGPLTGKPKVWVPTSGRRKPKPPRLTPPPAGLGRFVRQLRERLEADRPAEAPGLSAQLAAAVSVLAHAARHDTVHPAPGLRPPTPMGAPGQGPVVVPHRSAPADGPATPRAESGHPGREGTLSAARSELARAARQTQAHPPPAAVGSSPAGRSAARPQDRQGPTPQRKETPPSVTGGDHALASPAVPGPPTGLAPDAPWRPPDPAAVEGDGPAAAVASHTDGPADDAATRPLGAGASLLAEAARRDPVQPAPRLGPPTQMGAPGGQRVLVVPPPGQGPEGSP